MSIGTNTHAGEYRAARGQTCRNAIFIAKNPTKMGLGLKSRPRGDRSATNRLGIATAFCYSKKQTRRYVMEDEFFAGV